MRSYKHLIIGGGPAAGNAAKEFAEHGERDHLVGILSAESNPPYDRPPLSKGFVRGEKRTDEVLINDRAFYEQHGIDLHLSTRARRIDTRRRQVETEGGETYTFEQLLLCLGSSVKRLDNDDTGTTQYLRRIEDAERIRDGIEYMGRLVVVGGGYIAMEVAASLAMRGAAPDLLYPGELPLTSLFTPEMAEYFARYYADHGVTLHNHARVDGVFQENGKTELHCDSGGTIAGDTVIAGVGVAPNTALAESAGISCADGIMVDEYLESSVAGIFAAGDIARYTDLHYGSNRRVEHWQNAVDQGKTAARNMLGKGVAFDQVPYFFSDMFDLSWEFWGDSTDADEVLHVGDVEHGNFSTWWLQDGAVRGAFVLNRRDEERQRARICVMEGKEVPRDILLRGQAAE